MWLRACLETWVFVRRAWLAAAAAAGRDRNIDNDSVACLGLA